jgi:hypothetical protein
VQCKAIKPPTQHHKNDVPDAVVGLCRTLSSSKSGINYETNGWFFSDDSIANAMKNRVVITMPLLGMPVSLRSHYFAVPHA